MSVLVVVPAHNEEATIVSCLEALVLASAAPGAPACTIALVCDRCTDRTKALAERTLANVPHLILEVDFRNVGAARDHGVRVGLENVPGAEWIAFTDADSLVDTQWLARQWSVYRFGYQAYCGRVSFDLSNAALTAFWERYETQTHDRIHGANLGVSREAYLEVDGIPHVSAHEDKLLVTRLQSRSRPIFWDAEVTVTTSNRIVGRAPEGFAATLQQFSHAFGREVSLCDHTAPAS